MTRQTVLVVGVVILLAAAALRVIGLASYPPGPHYDEAANVIITRTVAFGGARPFPMVENYQGREVLYYYLSAPALALIHDSRFGLQVVGVYSNLLLVALTIALGRAFFPGRRGVLVGLIAGAVAAVSLPQVLLARQAFRAITLPTLQAAALLLLWAGLRRRSYWRLALAGVLAGATVYTYNASRLFPVWLALSGAALLVFSAGERAARLRQGVVFLGLMAVVAGPLALYGLREPDIFLGRLYEVTGGPDEITLQTSVVRHTRMFFIAGETLLRYNPRGRPYFTPAEAVLLLAGVGVAVWGMLNRRRDALERAAYVLLALAPLMVIPSVIATSGFPPNHMRSIGMVPLIFLLVGVGGARLLMWGGRGGQWVIAALLLAVGLVTARDYTAWATNAELYNLTDADLAAAAQWAQGQGPVYIAAQDRFHPTIQVYNLPGVRWLGTDTLFVPPEGERAVIFPRSAPPPDDWRTWLEAVGRQATNIPTAPDGRPAFEAYWLGDAARQALSASGAVRNPALALMGGFSGGAYPNGRLDVTTQWRVLAAPAMPDLTPILQLEDSLGNVIARAESFSVGTDSWEPGEVLWQQVPGLRVPVGTPPGDYPLYMAWVGRQSDTYLTYSGTTGGIWAQVGTVEVLRPNNFPPATDITMDERVNRTVADGLTLLGWETPPTTTRPGETLRLTLYWQATDTPANVRYALLLGETPLETVTPTFDAHPSAGWLPGQLMMDRLTGALPRTQPPGTYPLRLHVGENLVDLGNITLQGVPRVTDAPPVAARTDAVFGETIALYGYTLDASENTLNVEVVWESLNPVELDYTVFVHLVDPATGAIIDQVDRMPVANTYPTSLWLPPEFIADTYQFLLPQQPFAVRLGLYDSRTAARLSVDGGSFFEISP